MAPQPPVLHTYLLAVPQPRWTPHGAFLQPGRSSGLPAGQRSALCVYRCVHAPVPLHSLAGCSRCRAPMLQHMLPCMCCGLHCTAATNTWMHIPCCKCSALGRHTVATGLHAAASHQAGTAPLKTSAHQAADGWAPAKPTSALPLLLAACRCFYCPGRAPVSDSHVASGARLPCPRQRP